MANRVNDLPLFLSFRPTVSLFHFPFSYVNKTIFAFFLSALFCSSFSNADASLTPSIVVKLPPITIIAPPSLTPLITNQTTSETITGSGTASFSVNAIGSPVISYQWWQSVNAGPFTIIPGAIGPSYTVAVTSADNGTRYECVVSNAAGSVTSKIVTLTVIPILAPPSIITQPLNATVTSPATASFNITANGTPAPTYQWMQSPDGISWVNVTTGSGATSPSYTTAAATLANNGTQYQCVVTNLVGSVTSAAAMLTVNPPIPSAPVLKSATAGNNQVALSWGSVTGATSYSIAYGTKSQVYGQPVSVPTSNGTNYTVTGLTDGTKYYFVITAINAGGSSANSNELNAVPQLSAPVLKTPTPANGQVTLNWGAVTGATNYSVIYKQSTGQYGAPFALGNVTSYIMSGLTNGTTYDFELMASNAASTSAYSNQMPIVPIGPAVSITSPGNFAAYSTSSMTFTVSVSDNGGTITQVDYYNGGVHLGVASSSPYSLTLSNLASGTYNLTAQATDSKGATATSTPIVFTILAQAPSITSQPVNATVIEPATATFSVTATGTPAPTYQWMQSTDAGGTWTKAITGSGGTSSSYTTAATTMTPNATEYECVVTNSAGSTTSAVALLAVNPAATVLNPPTPGSSQASLTWSAVPGVTVYDVLWGTSPGGEIESQTVNNVTSYIVPNLTNGTKYYFVVRAWYEGTLSALSNEQSTTPQWTTPAAPSLNAPTAGNAQVSLSWNAVSATSYSVSYGTSPGGESIHLPAVTGTSYTVPGLTNGTPYYFVVTASNPAGTSVNSNEVSTTPQVPPPAAPVVNTPTPGNAQVSLTWGSVTGATSYSVAYGTATKTYGQPIVLGNVTSYTVPGLINGTPYYFVVTASNPGGPSSNSNEVSATPQVPPPAAPALNAPTAGNAQVSLSWNAVTGATSYSVAYGIGTKTYGQPMVLSNVTSYTVPGLTNGTTYYFVVTASNAGGTSANSNEVSATPRVPTPVAPSFNVTTAGNRQVSLAWNAVSGATSYSVLEGTSSGSYSQIPYIGSGTSCTVSNLANGTKYYFVVTASNSTGTSAYSTEVNATPLAPPAPPVVNAPTAGNTQVSLIWNTVTGATSYSVAYGTSSGGESTQLPAVNGTSYTVTGLINGTPYYFVVTATNAAGPSSNSNEVNATPEPPPPAAPALNTPTPGDTQVTLTWGSVAGATSYSVSYGTLTGVYGPSIPVPIGNGTSYTVTGLTNGTPYYFVVTASNGGGTSVNSNERNATPQVPPPATPVLNMPTTGSTQVSLTWNAVTGATSYSVAYGTSTGVYAPSFNVGNLTSYIVPNLTNGTTYYFVVTANNAGGASINSNERSTTPQLTIPIAPVLNLPTAGNTQVSLTWSPVPGATSYSVSYGTSTGIYQSPSLFAGNFTNYTVPGLTNGTKYYFAVTATNTAGTSVYSNELTATPQVPAPAAPVLNPSSLEDGNAQISLYWNPVPGATNYLVAYGTKSGIYGSLIPVPTSDATTYTVPNLTNGTTYYFVVIASNGGGSSAYSNELSATPQAPPAAPVLNTATAGNGQVILSWGSVPGAIAYSISYGTISGQYPSGAAAGNVTSYTVTGLTNGTTYYFIVTALNQGGPSGVSNVVNAIPQSMAPAAPVIYGIEQINTQVYLNWHPASGATSYSVSYGTASGVYGQPVSAGSFPSYTMPGLTIGQKYYFAVKASNAQGPSAYSNEVSITMQAPPPAPLVNTPIAVNGQVSLTWGVVSGATSYTIFYGSSPTGFGEGSLISVPTSNGTSYVVTGLTNGTTYYFVVTATGAGGTSGNSNVVSATPQYKAPVAPVLSPPAAGNIQVSLTWNTVLGADSYFVAYGTASGAYGTPIFVPTADGTNYTVPGLTNGTKYYFVVTASNGAGTSGNSNEVNATPQVPAPLVPILNTPTAGNAQVSVSWNTIPGATSYSVAYGTSTGFYGTPIPVPTSNGTSYTVTGLTNGTKYYFVVTASNAGGTSANSYEQSATPQVPIPAAPVLNAPIAGNGQVALSWGSVTGATSYSVAYGIASGSYGTPIPVPTSNGTSYTVTGLTVGTKYYFVVTATNAGGTSVNSNVVNAIPVPLAPVLKTPTAGSGQVALTWGTVSGATSYSVAYGIATGVYGSPISVPISNGTSYTRTGLVNGEKYYFVVVANNAGGASVHSNEVSATPQVPAPIAPVLNTPTAGNGQVTLSWGSVTGATSYFVSYRTLTGTYGTPVLVPTIDGTSYTVPGLTNGTLYYFMATASNAGGTSINSNEVNATPQSTAIAAPVLNIPIAGNSQVSLTWGTVTGAASYLVQYGSSAINVGQVTNFTVTGLTNGTIYSFVVAAVNSAGASGPNSNVESATPAISAVDLAYTYDDLNRMTNEQKTPAATTFTYDEVGNILSVATAAAPGVNILLDTNAPSTPMNLVAAAPDSHHINLTWNPSTDNVGVFGYVIYRNGFKVGTTTLTSFVDVGLVSNTMYSYIVRASDAAGNLSGTSSTQTLTTP